MTQQTACTLDSIPLLAPLTPTQRRDLEKQCRMRRYADGEHIIDGLSDSRDVFFIIDGTVRVVNFALSGREVTLDDITAGGFFGELAALDGGPRSAFVMAHNKNGVMVAMMPHAVFIDMVSRYSSVGFNIMQRLARIVRQATDRIMDLSSLGAHNRVHAEVLRLAWSFTSDGRSALIAPVPHHAEMASRVSTTRETVARAINGLVRDGILVRRKEGLFVPDMVRLATLIDDMRNR